MRRLGRDGDHGSSSAEQRVRRDTSYSLGEIDDLCSVLASRGSGDALGLHCVRLAERRKE